MAASKSDKPKAADKKVMDVAKPGKSAPSSTSKPVIVGHKPMIQDPMVMPSEGSDEAAAPADEKVTSTRSVKKIVPLSDQDETTEVDAAAVEPAAETESDTAENVSKEENSEESSAEEPSAAAVEEAPAEQAEANPSTDETAAVDAIASQATKRKEGDLTEEEKKKAEAINKLIEDKTYYLKIGHANKKRNSAIYGLLALVLVMVVAGALAIDAGLVETGITLPFDLISN